MTHDSFTLTFTSPFKLSIIERAIVTWRGRNLADMRPAVDEAALRSLKFSECLPLDLATEMPERRLQDPTAVEQILAAPVRSRTYL